MKLLKSVNAATEVAVVEEENEPVLRRYRVHRTWSATVYESTYVTAASEEEAIDQAVDDGDWEVDETEYDNVIDTDANEVR